MHNRSILAPSWTLLYINDSVKMLIKLKGHEIIWNQTQNVFSGLERAVKEKRTVQNIVTGSFTVFQNSWCPHLAAATRETKEVLKTPPPFLSLCSLTSGWQPYFGLMISWSSECNWRPGWSWPVLVNWTELPPPGWTWFYRGWQQNHWTVVHSWTGLLSQSHFSTCNLSYTLV